MFGAGRQRLESGDVNMIFTDAPEIMVDYKDKAGYKAVVDRSGDVQSIVMNQASEPFENVNARKAVVLADRLDGGDLKGSATAS